MRKLIVLCFFITVLLFSATALGVDLNEIQTGRKITFINYTGIQPVSGADIIKGIGVTMSKNLKAGKKTGNYGNKYQVIHAFDAAVTGKYDADIITLTTSAGVNHIDSLRLIIAGYLEEQYGYTLKDARTLAIFITIYNAVHRQDLAYFTTKYKPVVINYLKQEILGLSVNFKDWPGKTQIVIPITEEAKFNEISSLDTSELTDQKVITSLKAEEDKGIEERKDMVEIKEKEIVEDKQDVEAAKEEVTVKKEEVAQQKEEVTKQEKEIIKKEEEIAQDKQDLTKITDEAEKTKKEEEIKAKEEEVTATKEEVTATNEEIKKTEQDLAAKETEIKKQEDEIAAKEAAIEEEKKDIAKDERIIEIAKDPEKVAEELAQKEADLKAQEENLKSGQVDEKTFAGKFYYLQVEEYLTGGHYHNSMYILNANTGEVLVKAPATNISGKKYDIAPSAGVVVITHKGVGDLDNYLTILDLDTLAAKYVSEDTIFHRSFVEVRDKYIYVVANLYGTFYLGKYDLELKRVAVSTEKVFEDSFITFYNDRVYINDRNDNIMALKLTDLSLIEKISP